MARHSKSMPAWLMGLIIAVVVFVVLLFVMNILGFGDDPVVEGLSLYAG